MNPAIAAGKFYDALQQVPGWQGMPVTVAAQRVQRSAFPDAYADDESSGPGAPRRPGRRRAHRPGQLHGCSRD